MKVESPKVNKKKTLWVAVYEAIYPLDYFLASHEHNPGGGNARAALDQVMASHRKSLPRSEYYALGIMWGLVIGGFIARDGSLIATAVVYAFAGTYAHYMHIFGRIDRWMER